MENGNTMDISALLQQVMETPGVGEWIGTMQKQMTGESGGKSGGIPPQMMEKLPEILTMLGSTGNGSGKNQSESEEIAETAQDPGEDEGSTHTVSDGPAGILGSFLDGKNRKKRNQLLVALKPYLSPNRCEILDRAMSAMQLGELLGDMYPVYGQFLRGMSGGKE